MTVIETGDIQSLAAVSCLFSIVTMAVSVAVCEIFGVKEWLTLKTGLGFVQVIGNGTI